MSNEYLDYNNQDSPTYHTPDSREFNVVERINELKDKKSVCIADDELINNEASHKYYTKKEIDSKFRDLSIDPDGLDIPTKTSQLTNDSGYITSSSLSDFATLGDNGKIPSSQLPSYVDDVLEYTDLASFPETGESGKIYIDITTNITYRWGGTVYVVIGSDLAIGETSSTAYAGDKGKAIADLVGSTTMTTTATTVTGAINELKSNFQDGVDSIYDAIVAQGTTPSNKSLSSVVTGIGNMANNKYNAGVSATKKGTAIASDVLSGKTFTNDNGVEITGTLAQYTDLS